MLLQVTDAIKDTIYRVGDDIGYYQDSNKRVMLFGHISAFIWEGKYYIVFIKEEGDFFHTPLSEICKIRMEEPTEEVKKLIGMENNSIKESEIKTEEPFKTTLSIEEWNQMIQAEQNLIRYRVRTLEGKNFMTLPDHTAVDCRKDYPKYVVPEGKSSDPVNSPSHYTSGSMEVIDMMEKIFGAEAVMNFCELNAFKYRMRAGLKDATKIQQDIDKAMWYEKKLKQLKNGKNI